MHVKVFSYKTLEERLLATVRMVDGKVQIDAPQPLAPAIEHDIRAHAEQFKEEKAYLTSLPMVFCGAYTKAQFFKD